MIKREKEEKKTSSLELPAYDELIMDEHKDRPTSSQQQQQRTPVRIQTITNDVRYNTTLIPVMKPPNKIQINGEPSFEYPFYSLLKQGVVEGYQPFKPSITLQTAENLSEFISAKLMVYQLICFDQNHTRYSHKKKMTKKRQANLKFDINADKDPFIEECMFDLVICYLWRMGRVLQSNTKDKDDLLFCYGHMSDLQAMNAKDGIGAPIPRRTVDENRGEPSAEDWISHANSLLKKCTFDEERKKNPAMFLSRFVVEMLYSLLLSIRYRFLNTTTTTTTTSSSTQTKKKRKLDSLSSSSTSSFTVPVYIIPDRRELWSILCEKWSHKSLLYRTSDVWLQKHGMTYNPFSGTIVHQWAKQTITATTAANVEASASVKQQRGFRSLWPRSNLTHEIPKFINPQKLSPSKKHHHLPMFYSHPYAAHLIEDLSVVNWSEINHHISRSFEQMRFHSNCLLLKNGVNRFYRSLDDGDITEETSVSVDIDVLFANVQLFISPYNNYKKEEEEEEAEPLLKKKKTTDDEKKKEKESEVNEFEWIRTVGDVCKFLIQKWIRVLNHILYVAPAKFSGYMFDSDRMGAIPLKVVRKQQRHSQQSKEDKLNQQTIKLEVFTYLENGIKSSSKPKASSGGGNDDEEEEDDESDGDDDEEEEEEKKPQKPKIKISTVRPVVYIRQRIQTFLTEHDMETDIELRNPILHHPSLLFRCYRIFPAGDWNRLEQYQLVYDSPSDVEWTDSSFSSVRFKSRTISSSASLITYESSSFCKVAGEDYTRMADDVLHQQLNFFNPRIVDLLHTLFEKDPSIACPAPCHHSYSHQLKEMMFRFLTLFSVRNNHQHHSLLSKISLWKTKHQCGL